MPEESHQPVPWHVELWVAIISRPLVASAVIGLIPGTLVFFLTSTSWAPSVFSFPGAGVSGVTIPGWLNYLMGWFAGLVTVYIFISRPY